MTSITTIEGFINTDYAYHYDCENDVLYIRKKCYFHADTYGEESDDGFIQERLLSTDELVGVTIVNWWNRFGDGAMPESYIELGKKIEPFTNHAA